MPNWRAYYADASYSSDDTAWADLPEEGMLIVVEYDNEGRRRIVDGGDWYWMEDGRVNYVPSKEWGKDEPRPKAKSCSSCVKKGGYLPDDEFYALYSAIRNGDRI